MFRRFPIPTLACLSFLVAPFGCTRFDALNATVPRWGYQRTTAIPYGPIARQRLDVYLPSRVRPGASIVIFFYGGDWQSGSRSDYRFVAEALTSRGFIAVLPDYRLYPSVTFPAFVQDGALAVRWTQENIGRFGGDVSHIYLMGHSAGAHIAAMLALDAHYLQDAGVDRHVVRATVALSGPYDFVPSDGDLAVFGMKKGDEPDPRIEPIHFADGQASPILLIHGLKDRTVDPSNATRLAKAIRRAGGDVRLITYANRAHVGIVLSLAAPFRWLAPTLRDVAAFFREQDAENAHLPPTVGRTSPSAP